MVQIPLDARATAAEPALSEITVFVPAGDLRKAMKRIEAEEPHVGHAHVARDGLRIPERKTAVDSEFHVVGAAKDVQRLASPQTRMDGHQEVW